MLYEKLPRATSIRLFSLLPGKTNDGIEGGLVTVSLNDCPAYEALSYVVGDTSIKTPISCDRESITITKNLQDALLHLRKETNKRILWIDQICINQTDPEERNQQVSMMGQIFHKPQRVIAWLGPADASTPEVWQLLRDLASTQEIQDLHKYHMNLMVKSRSPTGLPESEYRHPWYSHGLPQRLRSLPPQSSSQWNALQQILTRPWFDRVWTFQEGIVSVHCEAYCGTHTMPWLTLSDACKAISVLGLNKWIGEAHSPVAWIDIQALRWHSQTRSTLQFILYNTKTRRATDAKDKIYAIRALVKKPTIIKVEYKKALQDVYSDAVKACITQDDCLSILSCVEERRTHENAKLMPSWVPDWRFATSVSVNLAMRTIGGARYFDAADKSLPYVLPAPNSGILTLRGFKVASVHAIVDLENKLRLHDVCLEKRDMTCGCGRWDPDRWRKMYRTAAASTLFPSQCIRQSEELDTMITSIGNDEIAGYSSGMAAVEMTFRRTVTADLLPRASGRLSDAESNEFYPVCASWYNKRFEDGAAARLMLEYDTCVSQTMFNRRLFIAGNGQEMYMGIALQTLRKDDCVCVLFGGDTPFLLRNTGDRWRFVAEAYVHGIMDGEIMRRARENGIGYDDFLIV